LAYIRTTPIWPVPEGEIFIGGLLEILQKRKFLEAGVVRDERSEAWEVSVGERLSIRSRR
jgi:hypothetical protein